MGPIRVPVFRESRDIFWDVEPAIWGEASKDNLSRARHGEASIECSRRLTSSKDCSLEPPRVEKYFITVDVVL